MEVGLLDKKFKHYFAMLPVIIIYILPREMPLSKYLCTFFPLYHVNIR